MGSCSAVGPSSSALLAYSMMSGEQVSAQTTGKTQAAAQVVQMLQDTVQISDAGRALAARG